MQMPQSSRSGRGWMPDCALMLMMSAVKIPAAATPCTQKRSESASDASLTLRVSVCLCARACSLGHQCLAEGRGWRCECVEGKSQSVSEKQRYVGEQLKSDWFPSLEHQMYSLRRMGLCDGGGIIMLMSYLWRGEIFHSNNWLNAMVKNCKAIFSFKEKHGLLSKDCFNFFFLFLLLWMLFLGCFFWIFFKTIYLKP